MPYLIRFGSLLLLKDFSPPKLSKSSVPNWSLNAMCLFWWARRGEDMIRNPFSPHCFLCQTNEGLSVYFHRENKQANRRQPIPYSLFVLLFLISFNEIWHKDSWY